MDNAPKNPFQDKHAETAGDAKYSEEGGQNDKPAEKKPAEKKPASDGAK